MSWLSGWGCRKSHIINQKAGAGTKYQIPFKFYKITGTDGTESVYGITMGKVYCNNKCRDDFGDIRFTEDDGKTELNYWIMEKNDGSDFDDVRWAANLPIAVRFVGTNDRTYLAYQDIPNGRIRMTYYDHTLKVWADPVTVDTIGTGDNHRSPAFEIDSNGYIYIFYGSHTVNVYFKKSTNPEDITAWGAATSLLGSSAANLFPMIFSNDNIILFFRAGGGNIEYAIKSVDGGSNWGSNAPSYNNGNSWAVFDMNPDGIYSTGLIKGNSDRIHAAFYRYEYSGGGLRQDIYYAYSDNEGGNWSNVDASHSETTISKAEAESYYKVFDSGSYNVDHVRCKFDGSNNPYLAFGHGGATDGTNKFAKWNGSSWDVYTVNTVTGGAANRWWIELETVSSSIHYIYLDHDGVASYDVEEWKTTDGGQNWSNTRHLTTDGASGNQYCGTFLVRSGYHNECKLVYHKGACGTSNNTLYYWNENTDTSIKALTAPYAIFWVEVSGDLSAGNVTIYIYYNKASATYPFGADQAKMDATFIFADHFYGDSLDATKWDLRSGAFGIASSELQETGTTGTRGSIVSQVAVAIGKSIMSKARWGDPNQYAQRWMCMDDDAPPNNYLRLYGNNTNNQYNIRTQNPSCYNTENETVADTTQNRIYETRWTSAYVKYLYDGALRANHTTCIPIVDMKMVYTESNIACGTIYTDWVLIRKFVDGEPTHGAYGAEDCDAPAVSSGIMDGLVCIN